MLKLEGQAKIIITREASDRALMLSWVLHRYWEEGRGGGNQQQLHRLPVHLMLAFGATSGLIAQTVTYPLDVVRRQMQARLACSELCRRRMYACSRSMPDFVAQE